MIRGVGGCHIQRKAKPIEILLDVLDIRVPVVERAMGRELLLDENLKGRSDPRRDDLGTFRVQIAAESLEVGGKQEDESSIIPR